METCSHFHLLLAKVILQMARTKTPFSDAIVFVVGGGNYIEYQNLQDYVKSRNAGFSNSAGGYTQFCAGYCIVISPDQCRRPPCGGWCTAAPS